MAFALDEASQQRIKQVRDFLHDYTRLRYTVLGLLAGIAVLVWWNVGADIDLRRRKLEIEMARQKQIEELRSIKRYMIALAPYLPDAELHDIPWWMDQFATAAREAGVQLDKSLPRPTSTRLGQYPISAFTVEAIGSYQGLTRFVARIENIRPMVHFDRVDVEELVGEAVRKLTVDMLPGERKVTLMITVLMSPKEM